jgi:hypothetical protein
MTNTPVLPCGSTIQTIRMAGSTSTIRARRRRPQRLVRHSLRQIHSPAPASPIGHRYVRIPLQPSGRKSRPAGLLSSPGRRRSFPMPLGVISARHPRRLTCRLFPRSVCSQAWRGPLCLRTCGPHCQASNRQPPIRRRRGPACWANSRRVSAIHRHRLLEIWVVLVRRPRRRYQASAAMQAPRTCPPVRTLSRLHPTRPVCPPTYSPSGIEVAARALLIPEMMRRIAVI